jgi:splicing factor 3B subunit 3
MVFQLKNKVNFISQKGSLFFKISLNSIFTIKEKKDDKFDKYIIVTFSNNTFVLVVKDDEVVRTNEHNFITDKSSLSVNLLADNSILQIHQAGFRHIFNKTINNEKFVDIKQKKNILFCCVNERQIVLYLTGGELIYYELNVEKG